MSSNSERLGEEVRTRRAELGLTQLEVSQARGPSNTKLTEIENDRMETLTNVMAKRLDRGLRWTPGSARRLWDKGEKPLPLPDDVTGLHASDVRRLAEQIEAARIDAGTRDELLRVLREGGA